MLQLFLSVLILTVQAHLCLCFQIPVAPLTRHHQGALIRPQAACARSCRRAYSICQARASLPSTALRDGSVLSLLQHCETCLEIEDSSDRRDDPGKLVFATYNTNNFVREEKDPRLKRTLAQTIERVNPDILLLTEILNKFSIECLLQELASLNIHNYRAHFIPGGEGEQSMALFVKLDISHPLEHLTDEMQVRGNYLGRGAVQGPLLKVDAELEKANKFQSLSKNVVAHFDVPGLCKPLTVIGVHLLSGSKNRKRCRYREAQARIVEKAVKKHRALGRHVVVLGDFNDVCRSCVDAGGNFPRSHALDIVEDAGLRTVAEKAPVESRVSCDKHKSAIDHIYILIRSFMSLQKMLNMVKITSKTQRNHCIMKNLGIIIISKSQFQHLWNVICNFRLNKLYLYFCKT